MNIDGEAMNNKIKELASRAAMVLKPDGTFDTILSVTDDGIFIEDDVCFAGGYVIKFSEIDLDNWTFYSLTALN